MHKHLDEKLCADFPLLYGDRHESETQTAMCWGFSIGDGWYQLVYDLSSKLESLIAKWRIDNRFNPDCTLDDHGYPTDYPKATQVKEKYGTLRFYLSGGTDEMFLLINRAEDLSRKICEECGAPGTIRDGSWLYCRCEKCHEQMMSRRYSQSI